MESNNKNHYIYEIKPFSDEDGSLTVLEEKKHIPFQIRRIFYEYGVSGTSTRGKHANKDSQFCLICVHGTCNVIVEDGKSVTTYLLDNPNKILYLNKMVWKTMTNFSKDCVLLVISDHFYNKDEYIRDFNQYIELLK